MLTFPLSGTLLIWFFCDERRDRILAVSPPPVPPTNTRKRLSGNCLLAISHFALPMNLNGSNPGHGHHGFYSDGRSWAFPLSESPLSAVVKSIPPTNCQSQIFDPMILNRTSLSRRSAFSVRQTYHASASPLFLLMSPLIPPPLLLNSSL